MSKAWLAVGVPLDSNLPHPTGITFSLCFEHRIAMGRLYVTKQSKLKGTLTIFCSFKLNLVDVVCCTMDGMDTVLEVGA